VGNACFMHVSGLDGGWFFYHDTSGYCTATRAFLLEISQAGPFSQKGPSPTGDDRTLALQGLGPQRLLPIGRFVSLQA
jgi:hypothetical protein